MAPAEFHLLWLNEVNLKEFIELSLADNVAIIKVSLSRKLEGRFQGPSMYKIVHGQENREACFKKGQEVINRRKSGSNIINGEECCHY